MSTFDKVKEVVIDKLGVDEAAITEEAHFVNDQVQIRQTLLNLLWNLKKSLVLKFLMRKQKILLQLVARSNILMNINKQ